ncbi:DUF397 domain-containing protein [Amycolatopsis sp. CA-230715]|uniref:DUF397 domain-containing protein n=1 Tax=Amycolatopsis sp. CA-230715 TaxID=2745196 RepID=UPI001C320D5D|nr:DUF397 domain-containing protein [Amycolatopsis sp. CA-230715]QWF78783.1 hypothetical protein HUW46_02181 [Amycolatopsis sp. CA-230715]
MNETWRKSSWTQGESNCVEARLTAHVEVRDTKDRAGGQIEVAPAAWGAFLARLDG